MAYENKPQQGNLWQNKHKKSDNHPFWRGSVHLDKAFLEELINKTKGNLVEVALAGWNKKTKADETFLSIQASEPYKKEEQSSSNNDIPDFMR